MPSRFGIVIEGVLVLGILAIWLAVWVACPPYSTNDGTRLYDTLGVAHEH